MEHYKKEHRYYCGIDLHAKSLYICVLDRKGEKQVHRNVKANPQALMNALEKYLGDLVIAVECMFTWYWVSDFCQENNIDFVLGHALYMKLISGAKAKNDKIDSFKIASLLRGGLMPVAFVYPKEMRSTRDLLRRRNHLMRKRAELSAHVKNTNSQYNLPDIALNLRYKKNRDTLAGRFPDKSAQKSVDLDLAMIDFYDQQLGKVEWFIKKESKIFDHQSYYLLKSVPGIGDILAQTILSEIYHITRFPTVQQFASYCRLVKCRSESAGKSYGTSGAKIGNAHLKWAFSEAAVLFLRCNPDGQRYLEKISNKHGKGKALSILAHKIGRAVYFMLKRKKAFNMKQFLNLGGDGVV